MAQISGFAQLLQKLKIISIEPDEDEAGGIPLTRSKRKNAADAGSSIYEAAYARSRGQSVKSAPAPARRASRASTGGRTENLPAQRADTIVYYVSSLSECAGVIRDIIAGTSVVINFDDTDDRMSQRIIDTLAGAAFALNAKVRKITDSTYLIAPKNVNVNTSRHIERRY